jgi:hypothetical protein
MKFRFKRLLLATSIASVALIGQGTAAWAGHNQGPECHGANQTPCRPDPQPTHGNDCGCSGNTDNGTNSNDHCGCFPPP